MNYQKFVVKVGMDKIAHFALSAFLVLALCLVLPVWISAPVAVAVGFLKEWLDSKTGTYWDWGDIKADCLGVAVATILYLLSTLI